MWVQVRFCLVAHRPAFLLFLLLIIIPSPADRTEMNASTPTIPQSDVQCARTAKGPMSNERSAGLWLRLSNLQDHFIGKLLGRGTSRLGFFTVSPVVVFGRGEGVFFSLLQVASCSWMRETRMLDFALGPITA